MNHTWIHTSDALPEVGDRVLCASKSRPVKEGWYCHSERVFGLYYEVSEYTENSFVYHVYGEKACELDVLYWMKLAAAKDTVMRQKWVNVEDRIPAFGIPVLGMSKYSEDDVGEQCSPRIVCILRLYSGDGWAGDTSWSDYVPVEEYWHGNTLHVTHWISLHAVAIKPSWVNNAKVVHGGKNYNPFINRHREIRQKLNIIQGGLRPEGSIN